MNEASSSNPDSESNPDDRKSWTPESFLANMLHELRTPIMIIKAYTEILSNEKAKEHHPKAIEAISISIGRVEDLYEDMANYYSELTRKS